MEREIILFKNHAENEAGRLVSDHFVFLKKLYSRQKQVLSTLVLIYFSRPRFGDTIKAKFITFQSVYPDVYSILTFCKRVWRSFFTTFWA